MRELENPLIGRRTDPDVVRGWVPQIVITFENIFQARTNPLPIRNPEHVYPVRWEIERLSPIYHGLPVVV